ncbi:hypothetical protein A4U49_06110 [Acidithiobacillus ferrivorans]|nr:hypothetical protein A4U49_06110 [Acidithiobacillus ferrivorans]
MSLQPKAIDPGWAKRWTRQSVELFRRAPTLAWLMRFSRVGRADYNIHDCVALQRHVYVGHDSGNAIQSFLTLKDHTNATYTTHSHCDFNIIINIIHRASHNIYCNNQNYFENQN